MVSKNMATRAYDEPLYEQDKTYQERQENGEFVKVEDDREIIIEKNTNIFPGVYLVQK